MSRLCRFDGQPQVDAGVALEPPLTADDLLDAFLERACLDDASAAAAPWGEKLGISIYDEEEVLGKKTRLDYETRRRWIDEVYDEIASSVDWDEDEDSEDSEDDEDDDDEDDEDDGDDTSALRGGGAFHSEVAEALARGVLPRAARSAMSFCCAYRLSESVETSCPICLEDLVRGEQVWRLPCTHVFHGQCAARSFSVRHARLTCPVCRCDVKRSVVAFPDMGLPELAA
mmetsp:Transcript_28447/g.80851  ORF Transcript_28447/g.80851 Transcript_28447/m.80851 type:complete len:229 (-) Transcript_28447:101-787(-)